MTGPVTVVSLGFSPGCVGNRVPWIHSSCHQEPVFTSYEVKAKIMRGGLSLFHVLVQLSLLVTLT